MDSRSACRLSLDPGKKRRCSRSLRSSNSSGVDGRPRRSILLQELANNVFILFRQVAAEYSLIGAHGSHRCPSAGEMTPRFKSLFGRPLLSGALLFLFFSAI